MALLFELQIYNERESLESKKKTLAQDDYKQAEKCGGAEEDEGEGEGTWLSLSRVNRADGSALGRQPNTPSNMITRPVEFRHSKQLENLRAPFPHQRLHEKGCHLLQITNFTKATHYNPMSIKVKFLLHFILFCLDS